mgnify:CR=1 FL=1
MSARPDLIVLGGDYVTFRRSRVRRSGGRAARSLDGAPMACSPILGNHDDDRDMPAALIGKGFVSAEGSAHAAVHSSVRR